MKRLELLNKILNSLQDGCNYKISIWQLAHQKQPQTGTYSIANITISPSPTPRLRPYYNVLMVSLLQNNYPWVNKYYKSIVLASYEFNYHENCEINEKYEKSFSEALEFVKKLIEPWSQEKQAKIGDKVYNTILAQPPSYILQTAVNRIISSILFV